MEFYSLTDCEWENGTLILEILLESGKSFKAPFSLIKKDRPVELARFIHNNVVETKGGGWYDKWAKNVLKDANRTLRRLHRYCRTDRISRLVGIKTINFRMIFDIKQEDLRRKSRTVAGGHVVNTSMYDSYASVV